MFHAVNNNKNMLRSMLPCCRPLPLLPYLHRVLDSGTAEARAHAAEALLALTAAHPVRCRLAVAAGLVEAATSMLGAGEAEVCSWATRLLLAMAQVGLGFDFCVCLYVLEEQGKGQEPAAVAGLAPGDSSCGGISGVPLVSSFQAVQQTWSTLCVLIPFASVCNPSVTHSWNDTCSPTFTKRVSHRRPTRLVGNLLLDCSCLISPPAFGCCVCLSVCLSTGPYHCSLAS
jgi:hypothetical protein